MSINHETLPINKGLAEFWNLKLLCMYYTNVTCHGGLPNVMFCDMHMEMMNCIRVNASYGGSLLES